MRVCVYVYIYVCVSIYICVCVCVCIYVCLCVRLCICVCINICMYLCVCIYIYICVCVCVCKKKIKKKKFFLKWIKRWYFVLYSKMNFIKTKCFSEDFRIHCQCLIDPLFHLFLSSCQIDQNLSFLSLSLSIYIYIYIYIYILCVCVCVALPSRLRIWWLYPLWRSKTLTEKKGVLSLSER